MFEPLISGLVAGILLGGFYALVSAGLSITYGVMKIVNLAHGSFIIVAGYITYFLFHIFSFDPLLSLIVTVPAVVILGLVFYLLLIHPLHGREIDTVLATLGALLFFQNLLMRWYGDEYRSVIAPQYENLRLIAGPVTLTFERFLAFTLATVALLSIQLLISKTYLGKAIRAIAEDRVGASIVGIKIRTTELIVFSLGMALTALSGTLYSMILALYPLDAFQLTFKAFIVVTLGGLGSLRGAYLGGLTLGLVEILTSIFIGPSFATLAAFLIFLTILQIRPQGLFGAVK